MPGKHMRQLPVHHEIRISPDGRSKMTVVLCGKTVMPLRAFGIAGTFERAQRHVLDDIGLGGIFRFLEQLLNHDRLRIETEPERTVHVV